MLFVNQFGNGFDTDYENIQMQGLEFGFRCNRFLGAVYSYISNTVTEDGKISRRDRHVFEKITKSRSYMILDGFWRINEMLVLKAKKQCEKKDNSNSIPPRQQTIEGSPTVSYIIPTMFRQEYTVQLLDDLACQSYKPTEVIVDATQSR
jgi:hypothetical protein